MEVLGYKIFPCQEGPSAELVADVLSVTREEKHRGPASEQIIAIPEWDGRGEKICLDYLGTGIKVFLRFFVQWYLDIHLTTDFS